jgi:N-acetylglutamate synthase-like GNAT family acetyltransferase
MDKEIIINSFVSEYQPGIDILLSSIQQEFPEIIYGTESKKITDVAFLPGRRYWVALDQDKVIGTIGIVLLKNNTACVKSMFLQKDYRGGGRQIAQRLLVTALNHARQLAAERIFLGTMIQFKAAYAFYIKHGFELIREEELPADFIKNPVDKVFFRLVLRSMI